MVLELRIEQVTNGWTVVSKNGDVEEKFVTRSKSELQRLFRQSIKGFRSHIESVSTPSAESKSDV